MIHTGYTNATDRVAAACITAVRPWYGKPAELRGNISGGLRCRDLVIKLATQAMRQGLEPNDLDNTNGTAALAAIASAILSGKALATAPTYIAAFTLTVEWKHVVSAAHRILDREVADRPW